VGQWESVGRERGHSRAGQVAFDEWRDMESFLYIGEARGRWEFDKNWAVVVTGIALVLMRQIS